ncbi:MAG: cupin domain-containing protein [bacterium]|nr:cupin domain-containing protein [bacterium]
MPTDAELSGKPQNLAGLLDYQPHAVVSRAIVDKPVGTLTLFAFDAGEGLSEHTAPYDAVVLVVDGSLEITISGKPSQVGTGQMLVMPAHEPHALRAQERAKMLLVMIRA